MGDNALFSPDRPLGRFGLVVAMGIYLSPFHVIFFAWNQTGAWLLHRVESDRRLARPSATRPSYYTKAPV